MNSEEYKKRVTEKIEELKCKQQKKTTHYYNPIIENAKRLLKDLENGNYNPGDYKSKVKIKRK